jgi:hypothetical protein
MLKYIKKIIDRMYGLQELHIEKINLPVLKQTHPLLTSHAEVSAARERIMKLNQANCFLSGAGIQSNRGVTFTLDLLFCRQLTQDEEAMFKEAIGNVSTKMSAIVRYSQEH